MNIGINNTGIDSSITFKYLRSLEALFEATPQAVLQLVHVMRTESFEAIFIISIIQSIISMSNSMLNEDNAYMTHPQWKSYKKRFPIPHFNFLKHWLFRALEITSRIFIFALFWTVVGGLSFSILLGFEVLFPIIYNLNLLRQGDASWEEFFLSLNIIVVMPPEWIFYTSKITILKKLREKYCGNILEEKFSAMLFNNGPYFMVIY